MDENQVMVWIIVGVVIVGVVVAGLGLEMEGKVTSTTDLIEAESDV